MFFNNGLDKRIIQLAYDRVYDIYGSNPPGFVLVQLDKELICIKKAEKTAMFLVAKDLVEYSHKCNYPTGTRSGISASLVAFLLNITENNPLPPHYLCPKCKHTEFVHNKRCGVDLEDKVCPDCGVPYFKLGFNIPMEEYFGFNGSRLSDIELIFAAEQQKATIERLKELCGTENVIKNDSVPGKYRVVLPTAEFNIRCLGRCEPSTLAKMETITGINHREISFNNPLAMALFSKNSDGIVGTSSISFFDTPCIQDILSIVQPKDLESIIHIIGIGYSSGCWKENGKNLLNNGYATFDELMSSQTDVIRYLTNKDFSFKSAYHIMERILSKDIKWLNDWTDFEWELFANHAIPDWYIEHISKIKLLTTRAQCVEYAVLKYRLAWFKANYPTEFNNLST